MKKLIKLIGTLVLSSALLTACAKTEATTEQTSTTTSQSENKKAGSILMAVNPEILINYDRDGKVVDLESVNEDAKKILAQYTNFKGKTVDKVLEELVTEIHAQGFFTEKIAGKDKNIILKLEKGSVKPSDDFVEKIMESVQGSIKTLGMQSEPVSLDDDDFDDQGKITETAAKRLAGKQLNIDEELISLVKPGAKEFEIEIDKNGNKYKIDLDKNSGKIPPVQDFDDWDDIDDADDDWYDKYDDNDADDKYEDLGAIQNKNDVNDADNNDYNDDLDDRDNNYDDFDDDTDNYYYNVNDNNDDNDWDDDNDNNEDWNDNNND